MYLLLLIVGTGLVWERPPGWREPEKPRTASWLAAVALPQHHQLAVEDLARPGSGQPDPSDRASLVGRHLLVAKARGEPIRPEDLTLEPRLGTPSSGLIRFILRPEAAEAPWAVLLRPGTKVVACLGTKADKGPYADGWQCDTTSPLGVVAVHRPAGRSDSAWIVLESKDPALAGRFTTADHRLLIQR